MVRNIGLVLDVSGEKLESRGQGGDNGRAEVDLSDKIEVLPGVLLPGVLRGEISHL